MVARAISRVYDTPHSLLGTLPGEVVDGLYLQNGWLLLSQLALIWYALQFDTPPLYILLWPWLRRFRTLRSYFCVQSAGLLEAVATAALRSRLRRHDSVKTNISSNVLGLLSGKVNSVEIRGTGWESRAGLTARVLEVSASTTNCGQAVNSKVAHNDTALTT